MVQQSFRGGSALDSLSSQWFIKVAKRRAPSVKTIVVHLRRAYLTNLTKEFSFEGYSSNQVKQILKYHGDALIEIMNTSGIKDVNRSLSEDWFDREREERTGFGWKADPESNQVKFLLFLLTMDYQF